MLELIKIDPFSNVTEGGKATTIFRPAQALSLHGVIFARSGTPFTAAMMAGVKAKLGGKTLRDLTGAQLEAHNKHGGRNGADGTYTSLYFGAPDAISPRGKHAGDIDLTPDGPALALEVDISGSTEPALEAYAIIGEPKQRMGLGFSAAEAAMFSAHIETNINPTAAVTQKAYSVGFGSAGGALLARVYFHHAKLTALTVKKGGVDIFEDIPAALANYIEADEYARTTVSGLYVYDRIVDGNMGNLGVTTNRDGSPVHQQFRLTTSDSDAITAYAEVLTHLAAV